MSGGSSYNKWEDSDDPRYQEKYYQDKDKNTHRLTRVNGQDGEYPHWHDRSDRDDYKTHYSRDKHDNSPAHKTGRSTLEDLGIDPDKYK